MIRKLFAASAALAFLLTAPATAGAQALSPDLAKRVDTAVEDALKRNDAPGASIAIVRDDKLVYAKELEPLPTAGTVEDA